MPLLHWFRAPRYLLTLYLAGAIAAVVCLAWLAGWGSDVHVTDRAVDNHVVSLRRTIEADPAKPQFIISARGMGHRFDG